MQADVPPESAPANIIGSTPLYQVTLAPPILTHIEARTQVVNSNGVCGRLVQGICDVIAENMHLTMLQAQVIEQMLLALIRKQLTRTDIRIPDPETGQWFPWFWYELSVRSIKMWGIEQDARRILGKDFRIFMKNTTQNFKLLQKRLAELGPGYRYLVHNYLTYHAYVLDTIYALSAQCQIPAWVPVDGEEGATKKIMLHCVIQLYPRVFYEDHQRNILWRKGGVLIEKMSYDDSQGIWVCTQEGSTNAVKIETAWYETYSC